MTVTKTHSPYKIILPLAFVILLDALGIVIVYPIFAKLFQTVYHNDLLYGIVLAAFPFGMLIGAPILGDLSDQFGRKKVLLLCLAGTCLGFILSAIALSIHSISLLLLGRFIDGLTGASQALAQAIIVDVSDDANKAFNLGIIVAAIYLGMVLGPLLGGFSQHAFLIAACLSAGNCLWICFYFKETHQYHLNLSFPIKSSHAKAKKPIKPKTFSGLSASADNDEGGELSANKVNKFYQAVYHKKLSCLLLMFLFSQLAWIGFYSYLPLILKKHYWFTEGDIAWVLSIMALCSAFAVTLINKLITQYVSPAKIIICCLLIMTSALLSLLFCHENALFLSITAILIAMVNALYTTHAYAAFSKAVSAEQQGWIMGVSTAVSALCFMLSSLGSGILGFFSIKIAFFSILLLSCMALALAFLSQKRTAL